jgi:hypothetical protein
VKQFMEKEQQTAQFVQETLIFWKEYAMWVNKQ